MGFYENYGGKYFGQFDSIPRNGGSSDYYYFIISEKDYSNRFFDPNNPINPFAGMTPLLLAASPVRHTWLDDAPKPYIKGSELSITLINKDNSTPLDTFYSEEDDKYRIDFYVRVNDGTINYNKHLFRGYLVQEDCSEEVTDFAHEINLVFTDGIGLLKEVNVIDAIRQTPKLGTTRITGTAFISITILNNIRCLQFSAFNWGTPVIGQGLIIKDRPNGDLVFTISNVIGNLVYVEEDLPVSLSSAASEYSIFVKYEQSEIVRLLDIYWICVNIIGLPLEFAFANMLNESSQTPPVNQTRILEYIYVGLNTFIDTNTSDSLDEVLNKMNYRFSSTLFQSDGMWNLVRWNELRNTGGYIVPPDPFNRLNADYYNNGFSWYKRDYLTNTRSIANGSDIEVGVLKSIERPLKYIEHNYTYSQNENVPFNGSFEILGNLLRVWTYVENSETFTVKEYEAIGWRDQSLPAQAASLPYIPRYIRVVTDSFGRETDRYLVIDKTGVNIVANVWMLETNVCSEVPITLNKGDVITISFEYRYESNWSGRQEQEFFLPMLSATPSNPNTYYFLLENGLWAPPNSGPFTRIIWDGDYNQWHTLEVTSKSIPIDGLSYICICAPTIIDEERVFVKNIKVEYKPYLGGNDNANGHQHKTFIPSIVKNKEAEDIFIDDTFKNYSKGTLFLPTSTGVVRDKTLKWKDGRLNQEFRLGEIITRQEQLWRNRRRLKLEGNIWPVIKNQNSPTYHIMSMLNVLNYLLNNGTYMIYGKLEIDYKENEANFTAYEMWKTGEEWWVDNGIINIPRGVLKDPNIMYTFKYLYK